MSKLLAMHLGVRRALLLLLVTALTGACGTKGPLYFPASVPDDTPQRRTR